MCENGVPLASARGVCVVRVRIGTRLRFYSERRMGTPYVECGANHFGCSRALVRLIGRFSGANSIQAVPIWVCGI